jgi:hypothetical protein
MALYSSARSQTQFGKSLPRWLDKMVFEVSAVPVSYSDAQPYNLTWLNFALGYTLGSGFELTYNRDLMNVYRSDHFLIGYQRLRSLGLAGNYRFHTCQKPGFFNGFSFSARLKAGITVSPEEKEQQSIFYDISARIYPQKNYFLAVGFNQDREGIWYLGYNNNDLCNTLYASFGLSF